MEPRPERGGEGGDGELGGGIAVLLFCCCCSAVAEVIKENQKLRTDELEDR